MIELLREAIKVADEEDEPAISNFLQERLDAHQKLNWKLTALVTYTV
ncbi:MAG: ferritin-like domain-containing protein [Bacteroidota bacterium]